MVLPMRDEAKTREGESYERLRIALLGDRHPLLELYTRRWVVALHHGQETCRPTSTCALVSVRSAAVVWARAASNQWRPSLQ